MHRLLLVRHGESEWNALGRWQGQADPPLSTHGRLQARLAAKSIGTVDAVVASTLERARDTAELISAELGVGPVHTEPRLIERDAGEWSGLTRAEIREQWPGYLQEDPVNRLPDRRPPSWESDTSLLDRTFAAIATITTTFPSGDILVVTHGGIIYALEAHLGAPKQYLSNLAARWISVDGANIELGQRLELIDHTAGAPSLPTDRSAI